jgi:hypothetical protein
VEAKRIDQLIQLTLAAAAQRDPGARELGPIQLIKYVYLGDLAHALAHAGATYTGAPWKFHHFGPWAVPVYQRIEPATQFIGAHKRRFTGKYQDDNLRWWLDDTEMLACFESTLPWEVFRAIRNGVGEYAADTVSLLHHVYNTAPMLRAAPGETLDFTPDENAVREPRPEPLKTTSPSKTAAKKLRARVQEKLAIARARQGLRPDPPPRYDEVFAQGVEWLDSLAGPPIEAGSGQLQFDAKIWKSAARREGEIP